jgi:hypothetical protein
MGNKTPQTPTFPDLLENFRKDLGYRLYCHLPGEIVDFNRTKLTATVKVALKRVIPDYAAETGSQQAGYPTLVDCPVFVLTGGAGSIGADPVAGDPCLIAVADRNIDAWFQNGGQQAPLSPRAHDLSDSLVFVGFRPLAKPLVAARAAGEAGISDASAAVVVMGGRVSIRNQADTLKAIIQDLIVQVEAVNTGLAAESGTIPTAAAAATAANVQLLLILTRLLALLY